MRHKYETCGIVLARTPAGEANALVIFLTPSLGIVRARAQGVRQSGAKLASSLATFAESDLVLVRGKESWRVAGAVLKENWFLRIRRAESRACATRICGLLLRLVVGEANDPALFQIIRGFFQALAERAEDATETIEILAALRILATLGFDTGEINGEPSTFTTPLLTEVLKRRANYISRINRGIEASGL